MLDRFNPVGTTDDVSFFTRKVVIDAAKSPINRVTLDGIKGNTWEETVATLLERHADVSSYVKNDGLDFLIPYVHAGMKHDYKPDFIVRLRPRDARDETERECTTLAGRGGLLIPHLYLDTLHRNRDDDLASGPLLGTMFSGYDAA